jgi:hypothetical protein
MERNIRHFVGYQVPEWLIRFQKGKWNRIAKTVGVLLSIGLFVGTFVSSAAQIDLTHVQFNWGAFLACLIAVSATMCIGIITWAQIACALQPDITQRAAVTAHLLSAPAKYIPGIAWNQIGKIALLQDGTLRSGLRTAIAAGLELTTTLTTGISVAAITSLIYNVTLQGIAIVSGKLLLAILSLSICLGVPVFLALLLHKTVTGLSGSPGRLIRRLFFAEVLQSVSWVLFGLAFWFANNIVGNLSLSYLPNCIVEFSTSIVLGIIVVFAPNGIGIREAALMSALRNIQQPYVTWISSVLIRIALILAEVIGFLAALCIQKSRFLPD